MKKQRPHKMCHWGPSIWGSFEVLSDRGDEMDDDESTYETTEMMPPLPPVPGSRRQRRFAGSFGNLAMMITETKRIHSLIVGMGSNKFDVLQQMDPWARNAPKPVPDVKGCLSVNFPVFSVWQKPGVYQRLPIQAPQYDICRKSDSLQCTPFESVTYPSGRGVKTGFSFFLSSPSMRIP